MASANNDFNVNLGDIMYSDSAVAGVPPALSLTDKWAKYRLNLTYPHLRNLRSKAGLFNMWDDHEFVDNFNRPQHGEELFEAGKKAFVDYNPVRFKSATGLYSRVRWGRNLEVFLLDERAFRSAPASQDPACTNPATGRPDPLPTLPQRLREVLGPQVGLPPQARRHRVRRVQGGHQRSRRGRCSGRPQMQAFRNAISRSTATFKVVVNAVPIQQTFFDPFDRWEGYNADRVGLLNFLRTRVRNVVFLTTDFHANMINNVRLGTFPEEGNSIDTGFVDFVTGPVALKTFAVDTDLKTGTPGASEAIRQFLKAPRPLGLGMRCAALDVYSYMQVSVTSQCDHGRAARCPGQRGQGDPERPVLPTRDHRSPVKRDRRLGATRPDRGRRTGDDPAQAAARARRRPSCSTTGGASRSRTPGCRSAACPRATSRSPAARSRATTPRSSPSPAATGSSTSPRATARSSTASASAASRAGWSTATRSSSAARRCAS